MNTRKIFVLFFSLLMMSCLDNKINIEKRNKAINKVLADQQKAWNSGNINGFIQGYKAGNGTTFITNKSLYFHRDTLEKMYNKSYGTPDKMGHLNFEVDTIMSFESSPKIALVIGNWEVKTAKDTNSHSGRFSLLFENNDQWKISVDQTW